ncbi:MAG: glutathione S-transferase N-terminal domain-containing protein [Deltaproteobacteria bacterium]|nr:glutathione S-transferase N-terminal domain-containing protein [Deltaproteobacteria bacterium]
MRTHSALADSLQLATSRAATWLRGAQPPRVAATPPALPLILYEFEACPYCQRVRAALEALGLEAEIRPCPKGGTRFRPEVIARGGKAQFPYLVDPNQSRALYESSDIVSYLYAQYAPAAPRPHTTPALAGSLASLLRGARGARVAPSREPLEVLILVGAESNPEARLVRELLCELELRHLSRRGDPNGSPRLEDPSASANAVGWRAIRALLRAYAFPEEKLAPRSRPNRRRLKFAGTGRGLETG